MSIDESEKAILEGIKLLGETRISEAEAVFRNGSSQFPESGIVFGYLGDSLLLQEKIPDAVEAHKQAVKLDSQMCFPRVMSTLTPQGMEYQVLLGDFAGKTVSPGVQAKPITLQRTLSLLALGSWLQLQVGAMAATFVEMFKGDLENDLTAMKTSLDKDPTRFGLWREYATTLELLDKQKNAIEAYSRALMLDPRDRLSQRGLIRTSLFKNNGERYGRFAKHEMVLGSLKSYQEALAQQGQQATPARRKATDVMVTIEIVQIASNTPAVYSKYTS